MNSWLSFANIERLFCCVKSFLKRKREEKLKGKIITDQGNVSYPGVIYPFYKVLTIFHEQCGVKLILVYNIKALVSFVHYITTIIIMIWEFHGQLNLFWMHYALRTFAAKSDLEKLGYISVAICSYVMKCFILYEFLFKLPFATIRSHFFFTLASRNGLKKKQLILLIGPYSWRQCAQNLMHKRAHFTVSRLVI